MCSSVRDHQMLRNLLRRIVYNINKNRRNDISFPLSIAVRMIRNSVPIVFSLYTFFGDRART